MTKVVGLAGRAGCGKSFAADYLVKEHGFTRVKFADSLKNIYRKWLSNHGCEVSRIEARVEGDMKEVVDTHFAELVYDTTANYLSALETLPVPVTRSMIESFHEIVFMDIINNPDLCTPRRIMQRIGTEWGRNSINDNFWVDMWSAKAKSCERVVSDDVRFDNEADRIRSSGGFIIEILGKDKTQSDHPSEKFDFYKEVTIRNTFDGEFLKLIESSL